MSLKGNLSSVNLTEIFQMLSLSAREGTLFIYEGPRKRGICFNKDGVSIRSRERIEASLIGKILVRLGRIEESDLQAAVETRRSGERLLGDVLVGMGVCADQDVEDALRLQTQEEIQELFLNRSDAQFEYVDGYFPESEIPFVSLNVNSLLIEIARRTDEWEYIRRRIRGPREIYRFTGVEGEVDAEVIQECYAYRIDPLIDGSHSIGDIIEISYVNKYEMCKLMAAYLDAGVIELVPPDAIRQNARLALRMGDTESAIRHYEYLMGTGDFPLDIMGEAAEAHEANRDFPEAAALLRRLAEELVRAGDYRGAIDVLRRVANYPRPEPEALRYLVDLVFENPRAAAEFAANIVEAGKTLVAFYIGQDSELDALELLQRLIKTFPDEVAFAVSLVNVYYEQGNRDQAATECERLANGFIKRKRPAHAVSLYKKLLIIDPERQDIRERIRKIVSGRRKRTTTSASLPRLATVLGITLLLGGVGVVFFKNQGLGGNETQDTIGVEPLRQLFARAVEEKQSARVSAGRAIKEFSLLVEEVQTDPVENRESILNRVRVAEENFQQFDDLDEKAVSIAETIRKQSNNREVVARARAMLDGLHETRDQVEQSRRLWTIEAQKAARRLWTEAKEFYLAGKLKGALTRFRLARQLATDAEWKANADLDRSIDNIRDDMDNVEREVKKAKVKEEEGNWTEARRIYLSLLQEYKNADIVGDLLLPVELLTVPPGAAILLNGVEYSRPTPSIVRLNPHDATKVELKKKGFGVEKRFLGPFGEGTDPAKYQYTFPLLKTATWSRSFREEYIESDPAAWPGRIAIVTRSGDWHIVDDTNRKTIARGAIEDADITAGLATDGRVVMIPTLDGRVVAFHAVKCTKLYTFRGTTTMPLKAVHATPAVEGNVFYIVDLEGNVFAFDARTKTVLWSQQTPHGVRASPVLQGEDLVVASGSGDITVLRRATGEEIMSYKVPGSFSAAPAVVGGDNLVFASEDGDLVGVRRVSGDILWRRPVDGASFKTTPPTRGKTVYVSPKPGHLTAINTDTGDPQYHYKRTSAAARTKVLAANRIFFVHGRTLSAYGPSADGYGLAWSFQAKGRILAGPVIRGGAVYIGDDKGHFYRLEAND